MKKIFVFLFLFFTFFSVFAQTSLVQSKSGNQVNNKPANKVQQSSLLPGEVLFLKEVEYDFGKIQQGKPVTHIFEVTNNGKDSLKIENIQASCGCTTPDWERNKIIGPNQKTNIIVGYNAASESFFTKMITISYNGSQTKQITIKGEVWKGPLTSAPENKELTNLKNL